MPSVFVALRSFRCAFFTFRFKLESFRLSVFFTIRTANAVVEPFAFELLSSFRFASRAFASESGVLDWRLLLLIMLSTDTFEVDFCEERRWVRHELAVSKPSLFRKIKPLRRWLLEKCEETPFCVI